MSEGEGQQKEEGGIAGKDVVGKLGGVEGEDEEGRGEPTEEQVAVEAFGLDGFFEGGGKLRGPGKEEGNDDEKVVDAGEEEALVHRSGAALDDVLADADAEVGSVGILEGGDAPDGDEEKGGDEGDEEGFLSAPEGAGLGLEFGGEGVVCLALFPPIGFQK